MSRTETQDGTYYYAEMVFRAGGLPRLLRTRLVDGVPHDEVWQVDTGEWVRTTEALRLPAEPGGGGDRADHPRARRGDPAEEAGGLGAAAVRWVSRRLRRWPERPWSRPPRASLATRTGTRSTRRDARTSTTRRRVAARVADDPVAAAVAWLHDTVEDTGTTLEELRRRGFPAVVRDAVDAMTRRDDEDVRRLLRASRR